MGDGPIQGSVEGGWAGKKLFQGALNEAGFPQPATNHYRLVGGVEFPGRDLDLFLGLTYGTFRQNSSQYIAWSPPSAGTPPTGGVKDSGTDYSFFEIDLMGGKRPVQYRAWPGRDGLRFRTERRFGVEVPLTFGPEGTKVDAGVASETALKVCSGNFMRNGAVCAGLGVRQYTRFGGDDQAKGEGVLPGNLVPMVTVSVDLGPGAGGVYKEEESAGSRILDAAGAAVAIFQAHRLNETALKTEHIPKKQKDGRILPAFNGALNGGQLAASVDSAAGQKPGWFDTRRAAVDGGVVAVGAGMIAGGKAGNDDALTATGTMVAGVGTIDYLSKIPDKGPYVKDLTAAAAGLAAFAGGFASAVSSTDPASPYAIGAQEAGSGVVINSLFSMVATGLSREPDPETTSRAFEQRQLAERRQTFAMQAKMARFQDSLRTPEERAAAEEAAMAFMDPRVRMLMQGRGRSLLARTRDGGGAEVVKRD